MTKDIRLEIDDELHRKFKAVVALEGKTIRQAMIDLLEGYVKTELPKEGITKFGKE